MTGFQQESVGHDKDLKSSIQAPQKGKCHHWGTLFFLKKLFLAESRRKPANVRMESEDDDGDKRATLDTRVTKSKGKSVVLDNHNGSDGSDGSEEDLEDDIDSQNESSEEDEELGKLDALSLKAKINSEVRSISLLFD